jgi:DNA-binding CsgD family transcriptional regulator
MLIYVGSIFFNDRQITHHNNIPEAFVEKYHITPREKHIIMMMSNAKSNKEIAYDLKITAMTVKNHIYNIYQKASVKSKVELLILLNVDRQTGDDKLLSFFS